MRFTITAVLVAAATTLISGVVADDQTSMATLTLTRTVQRVQTVTSTRAPSGAVGTGVASASWTTGYANATVSSASLTTTGPVRQSSGAAIALNAEMFGMAAVAGLAGLIAL